MAVLLDNSTLAKNYRADRLVRRTGYLVILFTGISLIDVITSLKTLLDRFLLFSGYFTVAGVVFSVLFSLQQVP